MSTKTNIHETDLLKLEFQNIDLTGLGDAGGLRGSVVAGTYYPSLHTADPGEGGSQTTNELSYTGYSRSGAGVVRSAAGWAVTNNNVDNAALISFGKRTDSGAVQLARFWGLGTAASGAGTLRRKGHIGGAPIVFTATTADVFTAPGHTMLAGSEVVFYGFQGAPLPTGITEGQVYLVLSPSGDTFQVEATLGGGAVNVTAAGAGYACPISAVSVGLNNNPQFAIGALDLFED